MKKPKSKDPIGLLNVVRYEYDGVVVLVKTDYVRGTISVVEPDSEGGYQPKRFVFAEREIEYMSGWLSIFVSLASAVNAAADDLQAYQSARKAEKFKQAAQNALASSQHKSQKGNLASEPRY